jgi:HPt (histidine-containing phosphotransfer) domain-containing protein
MPRRQQQDQDLKPVDRPRSRSGLTGNADAPEPRVASAEPTDGTQPLDLDAALEQLGNDMDLLREMVDLFWRECPASLHAMREAIASGDGPALSAAAHAIKGAASAIGAPAVTATALALEKQGKEGPLDGADGAINRLASDLDQLRAALDASLARGG